MENKKIYLLIALICLLTGVVAGTVWVQPTMLEKAYGQGAIQTYAEISKTAYSIGAIELSNTSLSNPYKTVFVAKEICVQAIQAEKEKCSGVVK